MAKVSDIRSRVYSALELNEADTLPATVDGWIGRAIADLSEPLLGHPVFADVFRGVTATETKDVDANNRIEYPANCLRILPSGNVNGRPIKRIVPKGAPIVQDEFFRASSLEPWLRVMTAVSDEITREDTHYLQVQPRVFQKTKATLVYLKVPTADTVIGDEVADAVTYEAARIGATENGDLLKLEIVGKLFAEAMARIGIANR